MAAVSKRASLVASKHHWDLKSLPVDQGCSSQNVSKWLTTSVAVEDAKHELLREAGAEPVKRNLSSDDDLTLGVEASLYGKQDVGRVKTVQEFLQWSRSTSVLSRWNSLNSSSSSGHTGPLSVMDILSLWNDDPEEVLLDLGFGCDEPDLSGRIPARFINHQSQARGINLQVFLEAQKSRIDLEQPDVSNRFRQVEVLQQVTTAFSALVGPSTSPSTVKAPQKNDLSPEARERRRRIGMLFRRASKKSFSQMHNSENQDPTAITDPSSTESLQHAHSIGDKKFPSKRFKTGLLENGGLSPLAEEQVTGPEPQSQAQMVFFVGQEDTLGHPACGREGHPLTTPTFLQRKRTPGQESFEMEEITSFDDSSIAGSYMGGAEHLVHGVLRTNSCQSDSSGFLEEPLTLSLPQQTSPGPDLIKALSGLSGGSTDSQSSEKPGSPCYSPNTSLPHLPSSSLISGIDKSLPSSPSPSAESSSVINPSPLPHLPQNILQTSEMETPTDHDQSPPALTSTYVTNPQSLTSSPKQETEGSEDIKTENKDAPCSLPSTLTSHVGKDTPYSALSSVPPSPSPSPNLDSPSPASIPISSAKSDSSGSPGNTNLEQPQVAPHESSLSESGSLSSLHPSSSGLAPSTPLDFHSPSSIASSPQTDSLLQNPEKNEKDLVLSDADGISQFETPSNTQKEQDELPFSSSLSFQSDNNHQAPAPLDSYKFENGSSTLPSLSFKPSIPISQAASSHDPVSLKDPPAGRTTNLTEHANYHQSKSCSHNDNTESSPASPVQDAIYIEMDHLLLDTRKTSERYPQTDGNPDLSEGSRLASDEICSQRERDPQVPSSRMQDFIHVETDHPSLDTVETSERYPQMDEKGEGQRHVDTVQSRGTAYILDKESAAGLSEGSRLASEEIDSQREKDPEFSSGKVQDEPTPQNKQEELRKVSQVESNDTGSGSARSSVLHEGLKENSRTEVKQKHLIEVDSLDMIFETSVDGSEGENVDMDTFFRQLDDEGRVYWAEPIQISTPTHMLTESGSFEDSNGFPENSMMTRGSDPPSAMDTDQNLTNATATSETPSPPEPAQFRSSPAKPDLKSSSRSVSVQMPSTPSSHIVYRKDVPYVTETKNTTHPNVDLLDTSTPFRAVQTWTDMQIQRNMNKLSHGSLYTIPNEVAISTGASEMTQRPTLVYSASTSCPLLSNNWRSHDCFTRMARDHRTVSASVDTGLWSDKEEEGNRNGNEDEQRLWECNRTASVECCCSCDHRNCCTQKSCNKQHTLGDIPYSLDDLEEMMLCLQQFRSVLSNMEEQLSEDQAAVYSALSDQDRETIGDIEELRRAVKQEARELEMQLNELAHHYDDSLKMKMHRLLDEQSLLCSQLRVFQPGADASSSNPTVNRTAATQCCISPRVVPADIKSGHVSSWGTSKVDPSGESASGLEMNCKGLGCSPTKADKLDLVSLLQKLRESLHHSLNTDSME